MKDRLSVQDFYNKTEQVCALEIQNLGKAFFSNGKLFIVSKDASTILVQYGLKEKNKQRQIELPLEGVEGVEFSNEVICFFFRGNEHLWIHKQGKTIALKSHFAPITVITSHLGQIVSGSADMTIRMWVHQGGSLVQDSQKHACSGHLGSIIALLSLGPLLLSSACDKKLLVWREKKIIVSKTFLTNILIISECPQSQQIVIYEQRKQIYIIDSLCLLKKGKIDISRTIDCGEIPPLVSINEIDESFIELVSEKRMQITEINLGQIMSSIDFKGNSVLAVKCVRRLTILALESRGLFTIKF